MDYDIENELHNKIMDCVREHSSIIEDQIKRAIGKHDCTTSQIELQVHPSFNYKILIKVAEFNIDHQFIVGGNND